MTPKKPPSKEGFICIGKVLAAHGLRGGLLAKSFTEDPLSIASYGKVYLFDDRTLSLSAPKINSKGVTFRIKEAHTRWMADEFKGEWLYIPEKILPKPKGREVYYKDLPGMVVELNGEKFGDVTGVFDSGAQDILEIKTTDDKEILVPYVEAVISKPTKNTLTATEEILQFVGIQIDPQEAEEKK